MAKFKVGDKVKFNCFKYPLFNGKTGTITLILRDKFDNYLYNIYFQKSELMANTIPEMWLELVEPKKYEDELYLITNLKTGGSFYETFNEGRPNYKEVMEFLKQRSAEGIYKYEKIETTKKLESVKIDTIKKAFERPFSDSLDSMAYILEQMEKPFAPYIFDNKLPYLSNPPKNRIPDRVVFNQDKGKVTVLISKHMDGVAPYWAYTVKTSENDKYDAIFGFMLAYFKYLNRSLEPKEQKAIIERVFKMPQTKRFPYLIGVVEQELLKLLGTTKKVEEIILAITSPNADMNYINVTWDYLEWKEMLRVHELETKREEQKAIRKQIKKHEQEIEKLKKKGV